MLNIKARTSNVGVDNGKLDRINLSIFHDMWQSYSEDIDQKEDQAYNNNIITINSWG